MTEFKFGEKADYFHGIWFVPLTPDSDWMGCLKRNEGRWVFEYRFRYYSPESKNPHDDKDEKNWFVLRTKDDSPELLEKMLEMINKIILSFSEHTGHSADFVDLQCQADDPKIFFELGSRPWAHCKIQALDAAPAQE